MKLLFNADDFGLSVGMNQGIIKSFTHGVVRSTTLMTNLGDSTLDAIALAKQYPSLDVGIHLNLFLGPSLSGYIEGVTDGDGNFFKWIQEPNETPATRVDWSGIKRELEAQIRFAFSHGVTPTHLDSHRHGHLHPELLPFVYGLAKRYKLKLRNFNTPLELNHLSATEAFTTDFYDTTATLNDLKNIIETSPFESLELMCHPACQDDVLPQLSSYVEKRYDELAILTDPQLIHWLETNGHELISF